MTKGEYQDRAEKLLVAIADCQLAAMVECLIVHEPHCPFHRLVTEHLALIGWSEEDLVVRWEASCG